MTRFVENDRGKEEKGVPSSETPSPGDGALVSTLTTDSHYLSLEHEKRVLELSVLKEISQLLSKNIDLDEMLPAIEKQVSRLFDTTNFHISIYEEETDEWILAFALNRGRLDPLIGLRLPSESGMSGYIIRNRSPLLLKKREDINEFHLKNDISVVGEKSFSWMGAPLISADRVVGVMAIQNREREGAYSERDLALFTTISAQAASAIDRKKYEKALKESEKRYRHLIENMSEIFFSTDHEGAFTYISPAIEALTGHSQAEVLGRGKGGGPVPDGEASGPWVRELGPGSAENTFPFEALVHQEDREKVVHSLQEAFSNKKAYAIEYRLLRKDGRPVWVYEKGRTVHGEGNESRIEGVILDIHQRKHAEEINQTLFAISNAVNTTENLDDLFRSIHVSLGKILDADNFIIALYDKEHDSISFPYFADQKETRDRIVPLFESEVSQSKSLTAEVIQTGKPQFYRKAEVLGRARRLGLPPIGIVAELYLGIPLKIKNEVIGVIIVRSYEDPHLYDQKDVDILSSISDQVAIAIQRKRNEEALRASETRIKNLSQQTEQFSMAAAAMIAMEDEGEIFERISRAIVDYSDYRCLVISLFPEGPGGTETGQAIG